MQHPFLIACLLTITGFCRVWPAAYYLDDRGDDAASGNLPKAAWKSLHKINSLDLQPGDRVMLKGGTKFAGELHLGEEDSGLAAEPVWVGSFGDGRALLEAGGGNGVTVKGASHVVIQDLMITGSGPTLNRGYGILCENFSTNGMREGLRIENVEVSGFGKHGIMITGAPYGFSNVTIRACAMHNNLKGGMEVAGKLAWDTRHYAHANVRVSECRAYDNPGDPNFNENHSGSGIVLYQVDGGRIERCKAWGNGASCPAKGGGPVGIWACASRRVIIEHCESFGNRTQGLDGGGFDLDGGSEECVLQYNLSHSNQGPGLMVYTYPYASYSDRGNVVRFNVSLNDAVKAERYAGLWIRADGRKIEGLQVYNNTIITSGPTAAFIHGNDVEATLANNIFYSATQGVPLRLDGPNETIQVRNNLYWRNGAPFLVRWNDRNFDSLAEFQIAGHEISNGEKSGLFCDPQISLDFTSGFKGSLPKNLLEQFRPSHALALKGGRAFAPLFAERASIRDFFGAILNSDNSLPFGAAGGMLPQ